MVCCVVLQKKRNKGRINKPICNCIEKITSAKYGRNNKRRILNNRGLVKCPTGNYTDKNVPSTFFIKRDIINKYSIT